MTAAANAASGNLLTVEAKTQNFILQAWPATSWIFVQAAVQIKKNRFKYNKECTHLTKNNVADFGWLPETCSYRLLWEGKELPSWHPLVSGKPLFENPEAKEIFIKNPVHEKNVENWEDYILREEPYGQEQK